MMDAYPGTYTDAYGCEDIIIYNDGCRLRVEIRGVPCVGAEFDALAVDARAVAALKQPLAVQGGCLCSCTLQCHMPLTLLQDGQHEAATLEMTLLLGDPDTRGAIDRAELTLVLCHDAKRYSYASRDAWFEDALLDIQAQLPTGLSLKSCINCQFADYSPYGHGSFASLMCFKNNKAAYQAVTSKSAFLEIHDDYDRLVQETYLCDEFMCRRPGTGYRG